MGIRVSTQTKNKATLKVYNALSSYLFEQECGELRGATGAQIKALREAQSVLGRLL